MMSKQDSLFDALKTHAAARTNFTAEQLATATGYTAVSIRTYFSKKLKRAGLVEPVDGLTGRYRATMAFPNLERGAFMRLMSQNEADPSDAMLVPADWWNSLVGVIAMGERKGFSLTRSQFEQIAGYLGTRVSRDG